MRLDGWSTFESYSLEAERCNCPPQRFRINLADNERPARELVSSSFKGLFGSLDRGFFQTIAKCSHGRIGICIDHKDRTSTADAAVNFDLAHLLHRRLQHLGVNYAQYADIEQLAKGPAGVVIGSLLRIV